MNNEQTQISYAKRDINEAIDLPKNTNDDTNDEVFTKDECEFLGWAFSKDAKTPVFVAGQRIGIDNLVGAGYQGNKVNVLYAVWRMKEVPVKIMKVDADHKAIKLAGGEFNLQSVDGTLTSGNDGYLAKAVTQEENQTVFKLETPSTNTDPKTYTLNETKAPTNYKAWTSNVIISVAYDGTVTYTQSDENSGNPQEAQPDHDGNYIIVVTNKLDAAPVKIVKIDQDRNALENAEFALSGNGISETGLISKIPEDGTDAVIYENESLHIGTYTLTETKAPAGYNTLEGDVKITVGVNSNGINVAGKIGDKDIDQAYITQDHQTGEWTVKIMNTAGVELPHTGGPGTTLLYILGALMIIVSGSVLVRRKMIS